MTNLLTPEKLAPPGRRRERRAAELEARTRAVAAHLAGVSARPVSRVLQDLRTVRDGLLHDNAVARLEHDGPNVVAHERAPRWYVQLAKAFWNPFILVLAALAVVMYAQWLQAADTEPFDPKIPILGAMVLISGLLRFWQEYRSNSSAAALRAWSPRPPPCSAGPAGRSRRPPWRSRWRTWCAAMSSSWRPVTSYPPTCGCCPPRTSWSRRAR